MKIVILDDWNKVYSNHEQVERLKSIGEVELYHDHVKSEDQLINRLRDADIVIPIRERSKFSKRVIENLPNLKLIAQTGTGIAHIDKEAAKQRGLPIAVTPGGSTDSVAELTFALMLSCMRSIPYGQDRMMKGEWPPIIGGELSGKTIGIIGLGKIGTEVARRAKAFKMEVIAWGPTLTKERANEHNIHYVSLQELLTKSDVISLHVRLVPETTRLLTKEHFQLMKDTSILINTARGKVINEQDLIWALENNEIGGAGLDVFEEEPISPNNPLLQLNEKVVVSPHIGWTSKEVFDRFLTLCVDNIVHFVNGEPVNLK
ncbi:D-2-hydroxyacid dehydrogenase family protein [Salirhabdus salicampi]|uniref:D-2-hydroxyacid dehydrogenase family protein n=1 Tax=Salirhabdus salicampi TaxID=476102 RepID=UPI0020C42F71|nr:D-2-hydroxyacid dehydrogenase family protein [Salirhabdus salicampi]MCP8616321.1 D-2-hydroxyacid dehydrogenase family protein [Salirhabdus salicampi]